MARIDDEAAARAFVAERALVTALGGGCQMPLGALAHVEDGQLDLRGVVLSLDGSRAVRQRARGPLTDPAGLGERVAAALVADGAEEILADVRQRPGRGRGAAAVTRVQVYLIGTGPGAPDLITVRGLTCLQQADVVLHDHLVHPRLLRQARAGAELIDVGLTAPQPLDQDAIAFLIIEKAREGKVVARLKWGDPFVFGMAGEEALFLHEQGIGFEIVPGVPAAIGVAAYAGIPLSHPGGGDTVTLIRGHEDEGRKPPEVNWQSLARLEGSLVCYAGPHALPAMIDALLTHGRPPDESAALVYGGTSPAQQTVQGTLAEIAEAVKQPGHHRAAMLIVGRVVGLRAYAALVRRAAAVRPADRRDAAARAGRRARRPAGEPGRGGD